MTIKQQIAKLEAELAELKKQDVAVQKVNLNINWGQAANKAMNWQEAKDWCEAQGGRLPTRFELQAAVDGKVEGFGTGFYWSGTESSATLAWTVSFTDGYTNYSGKTTTYYVRCVRGR